MTAERGWNYGKSQGSNTSDLPARDTAGQERFRALSPMYYRGAHIAIVMYAINNSVRSE